MTVYLDNAATTCVSTEAAEAVLKTMTEDYGNPSSSHHMGRNAAKILEAARERIALALGADAEEIYFTSGGTESDNWAIRAAAHLMRHKGRHIITTAVEHDAVRKTVQELEANGAEVTCLAPDEFGRVSAEQVEKALREDTVLISVMMVNNETGAVNPIKDIAEMLKRCKARVIFHTDAVQGFLKVPFSAKTLGADLISISSHKIHGPKGMGALYVKKGLRLTGMLTGGSQEKGIRPGTEALPLIAGFGAAAEAGYKNRSGNIDHMRRLRERLRENLAAELPDALIIGGDAPHILSMSLPGYRSEVLMSCLDADGICVSKSSACKKGARSHVLEAMRLKNEVIDGAIRVSLSRYNTQQEIDYFTERLLAAAKRLRHTR